MADLERGTNNVTHNNDVKHDEIGAGHGQNLDRKMSVMLSPEQFEKL